MKYGLSDQQRKEITDILTSYKAVEKAILFGSRAIDTYKEASDVDIAIKGENADWSLAMTIQDHLEEETYLPFFFDVVAYGSVESEELRRHIDGKGKVLFCRGMSEELMENGELRVENGGSAWQEVKIEDLGLLQRGRSRHRPRYAFHLYGGKYPFVQTGQIRESRKFINHYEQTYREEGLKQSKLWPKGTLCITIAANIAELGILSFDACFPDSVLGFIPNEKKVELNFIYYTLIHFQKELKHIGEGSVQDNINLGTFQNVLFPIPPLPEQKAIAEVLSALDEKIDLLHRQNKTLEQMAETLYERWVSDKEYDSSIKDLVNIQNGYAFKSKDFQEFGSDRILKIKNISRCIVDIQITDFVSSKTIAKVDDRFFINEGDVLFAMTGAKIGKMGIIPKTENPLWLNQRVGLFKEKYKGARFFAYLHLKSDWGLDYIENTATGSAQPNISRTGIESCEFPKFGYDEIKEYSEQLGLLFDGVIFNLGKIHTLQSLRDTLLPKLMSGEVRVTQ